MKKIFSVCAAMIAAMTLSAQTPIVKSCAEAAAIALALTENNAPTEEVYSITGYVTNVVSAVSKGQQTFWMDDEKGDKKTFQSYYCNLPKDDQNTLNVGDKVKIVGKIMKYNTTPEMKNGDITILNRVLVQRDTFTVTTCEAYEECSSLENGDASIDIFIVRDEVMSVDGANVNYGWQNITFKCSDSTMLVGYHIDFGGKDNFCTVGDSVEIIGTLKNYEGKMEIEGKGVITGRIITYTATSKLTETTDTYSAGLHTNAFNVSISSHTFSNGTGTITFSGKITTIGDYAFAYCSDLTSVTIPNSVTTIGDEAFRNCTGLTSVTIGNSVTTIGEGAFYECSGLTSPVYNNTIFAFMPTSYTGAYTIPNGITQIAGGAFAYCGGLTSVTIPNSVTTIGQYAFSDCSGLTSITIGNSVTTIGEWAFNGCSGLADIYCYAQIPPTCTNTNAFDGINEHCYIHVPVGTMRAYQFNNSWTRFYHFFEISEVPVVGTDQVSVEVTNNTAVFSWPVNPTASSYTLVIKKNDEVFCTLTFNSLGQLVGMAFAPARGANNDSSAQSTAYGYSFMVSNLDASSTYDYTFTAKDASNNVLSTTTGQFKIEGTATFTLPDKTAGQYATICLPKPIASVTNGVLYKISYGNIYEVHFVEETNFTADPAGTPYLVQAEAAGDIVFTMADAEPVTAPISVTDANGFVAWLQEELQDVPEGYDYLLVSGGALHSAGPGCQLSKNHAYIDVNYVPATAPEPQGAPRRVVLYNAERQMPTGLYQTQDTKHEIQKLLRNGQMLIIRENKVYNAQGQIVK